jgi:hypothetical protein
MLKILQVHGGEPGETAKILLSIGALNMILSKQFFEISPSERDLHPSFIAAIDETHEP